LTYLKQGEVSGGDRGGGKKQQEPRERKGQSERREAHGASLLVRSSTHDVAGTWKRQGGKTSKGHLGGFTSGGVEKGASGANWG